MNDKNNYVKQNIIVNSIIQKLKNKHTFLKKYTNWAKLSSLILREREETKTQIFRILAMLKHKNRNVTKWQNLPPIFVTVF